MKRKILMYICLVVIACVLVYRSLASYKDTINEKVISMGGTVISIENLGYLSHGDPFPWYEHAKGVYIYRITYIDKDSNIKVGWVRFSWGTEWKFD